MKLMKNIIIPLYIFALLYSHKDFLPLPEELLTMDFIITGGIDITPEGGGGNICSISFITGEAEESEDKREVFSVNSNTLSGAMEKIQSLTNKSMSTAHMRYILVGQEASEENLDYFLRYYANNPKIRPDVNVFLVKDASGGEFLSKLNQSGLDVNERLDGIINNKSGEGFEVKKSIKDLLRIFYSEDKSGLLPVLSLENKYSPDGGHKYTFDLSGLAVIKGGVIAGYIKKELLQGYLILTNKLSNGELTVESGEGGLYSLKIDSAKTKTEYEFSGDKLRSLKLFVTVAADFKESNDGEDVFNEAKIELINGLLREKITAEIIELLKLSQETDSDFLELGRRFEILHPYKYANIKAAGEKIHSDFDIELNVSVSLAHFYTINTEYIKK